MARLTDQNVNLTYSPAISGFDGNYAVRTTGSVDPTVDGSNRLVLNADGFHTKTFLRYADVEFCVTVPVAPTSGDVRKWGFSNPNLNNRGRMEFDITGAVFSVYCYDEKGNPLDNNDGAASGNRVIAWDPAWTNTQVVFRIIWKETGVTFQIGTITGGVVTFVTYAKFAIPGHTVNAHACRMALPLHVQNSNADSMLLHGIIQTNVQSQS